MFGISATSSLRNSVFTKIKAITVYFKHVKWSSYSAKHPTSYDLRSEVKEDVVLFSFENPKFFFLVKLFSASQCALWTYLGVNFFRSVGRLDKDIKLDDGGFLNKVKEKEKFGKLISSAVILFGWSVLIACWYYSFRSVRKIILHKGGRNLTIFTYNVPGYNIIKAPICNISAKQHRKKAKKFIIIKIKDNFLYFILDVKGNFLNPILFDFTVGVNRRLQ